jgi:hypothetical protein
MSTARQAGGEFCSGFGSIQVGLSSAHRSAEQVFWICQDTSPHSLRGFKGDHSDWCAQWFIGSHNR